MRWPANEPTRVGDERTAWVFPVVPMTLDQETRWLGFYRVRQVCRRVRRPAGYADGPMIDCLDWITVAWADRP